MLPLRLGRAALSSHARPDFMSLLSIKILSHTRNIISQSHLGQSFGRIFTSLVAWGGTVTT